MKLSDLWNWNGTIGRGGYLLWGVILFAVKCNVDRFLFRHVFAAPWNLLDYLKWNFPSPSLLSPDTLRQHGWQLLVAALPFLWAGVVLTIQRLRSARLPLWLAVLFVVPVVKWFLFLLASLVPRREAPPELTQRDPATGAAWRVFPRTRMGSALAAVGISALVTVAITAIGAGVLQNYGWGLFVGVPFMTGFLAAMIHGATQVRRVGESLTVAALAVSIAGAGFLLFAIEGLLCIAMAVPLALPLALIGGLAGHSAQPARWRQGSAQVACAAFLALPAMLGVERLGDTEAPLLAVKSAIEVNAPPARVWRHVVTFSELAPPTEWFFRAGIAYPLRAEIQGTGPGAIRHCVFTTGPFVEPIEVWDEPRLLRFGVTANPAPMQEWTPYREIHPPHLKGFLASERGQFLLTELPGGRTRLEGTTWYRHHLWPVTYWQMWSDEIIHRIHLRVLRHVQALAEADAR